MRRLATVLLLLLLAGTMALGQTRFRRTRPAPEPRLELKLPRIESITLKNGLQVWFTYRESAPIMSLHLMFAAGEFVSPLKTPGLATLAAGIFGQGTLLHSASEIEEMIEAIGGTFEVSADQDILLLRFHFLEEYLDEALDLIGEMILQPRLFDREVELVKALFSAELTSQERNPDFSARRLLLRLLFKEHPYEQFAFNREALKSWTSRDLQDYWDRFIRPNNAQILLTGTLSANNASRKISHVLNIWRPKESTPPLLPPPRPPDRDRICFIDVPQATNCTIYAGTILPPLVPGERFALLVLNQILGGSIQSRLFLNLREAKSYAYEAYSRPEFFRAGGLFTLRALVRPEVAAASVRELLTQTRILTKEPPLFNEINEAKSFLLGGFPLQLDRFDHFSGYLAALKAAGSGEELWSRFPDSVLDVSLERVLQTAQKYLNQPFIVVISGSRELCRESLKEFDLIEFYDGKGQAYTVQKNKKGDGDETR